MKIKAHLCQKGMNSLMQEVIHVYCRGEGKAQVWRQMIQG